MEKARYKVPQINISPGFCLVITLSAFLDTSGTFSFVILSVLIHEVGHLLAMILLNIRVESINFKLFGIEICADLPGGKRSAMVMIAGPVANLLSFALLLPFALFESRFADCLACCSLLLGCFHLLPAQRLDGGMALLCFFDGERSKKIAPYAVKVFTFTAFFLMLLIAVYLLLKGRINISAIILALYFGLNLLSCEKESSKRNSID